MSTLALVRHGQASFFSDNYDQLSPLGEQQARLLGEYWVRRGVHVDEVFTGPRVRQIETAALAGEAFARAGLPWPEPQFLPELDEHQVDRLIKVAMPQIAAEYPEVGRLHADYHAADGPRDKHRTFQLMFEEVVKLWVDAKVSAPEIETWSEFRERVRSGLKKIVAGQGRGRRVAAFSSVGAITVCLQAALDCGDLKALDLGWRVRNCTVTDFVFSGGRLTLEGFNAYPHLEDPAMWTYR
ncbi:MAG: histidine phosphatase family protein [Planctomycetota bacterium]|nr:MAG: histidine phosphatase family protein [Planctomycetota bacterium]